MSEQALLLRLHQENTDRLEAIAAELVALREDKETAHIRIYIWLTMLTGLIGSGAAGMWLAHVL